MLARILKLAPAVMLIAAGLGEARAGEGAAKDRLKLVMLGDSVTLSSESPEGKKLRDFTEKALNELSRGRPAWTVVNRGVGGETSEGGLARVAAALASEKPDYLTAAYGLNDARHRDARWFREKLGALVEAVGKHPAAPQLLLVTATPFLDDKHQWGRQEFFVKAGGLDRFLDRDLNGVTRNLAVEKNLPLCDLHRHFLREPKWAQFLRPDGVHMLPEGNEYAGAYIARCLYAFHLARVTKEPAAVGAEAKARAGLEKARKALETAPAQPGTEAELKQLWDACPYLPEPVVLLDKLGTLAEAGATSRK
jgi:lysophospholipase L1-like esterase